MGVFFACHVSRRRFDDFRVVRRLPEGMFSATGLGGAEAACGRVLGHLGLKGCFAFSLQFLEVLGSRAVVRRLPMGVFSATGPGGHYH